jgi:hypothetical protein
VRPSKSSLIKHQKAQTRLIFGYLYLLLLAFYKQ